MEAAKFRLALAVLGLVYLAVPVELSSKSNQLHFEVVHYPDMAFSARVLANKPVYTNALGCLGLVYDTHNIILEASCVASCKDDSPNWIMAPELIKVQINITMRWREATPILHKVYGVRVSEDFCKLKRGLAVLHTSRIDVEKFKPVRFYSGSSQSRANVVNLEQWFFEWFQLHKNRASIVEPEVCQKKWAAKPANKSEPNFVCVSSPLELDRQSSFLLTADQNQELIGFPFARVQDKQNSYLLFEPISNYKSFIKANVWTGEDREDCDDEDR